MKKGSKHTSESLTRISASRKVAKLNAIIKCQMCGIETEKKSGMQKFCQECKKKNTYLNNRRRYLKGREKYNENRRIKNAKRYEPTLICSDCGMVTERKNPRQMFCPDCKIKRDAEYKRQWVERNPEKVRLIKNEANRKKREKIAANTRIEPCALCSILLKIKTSKKYCPTCKPLIRARRERQRNLAKRNIFGSHTKLEFFQLCDSLNWKCSYCGKELNWKTATEDHVIPLKRGGSDDLSNITPACLHCNTQKGIMTYEEYMRYERRCVSAI